MLCAYGLEIRGTSECAFFLRLYCTNCVSSQYIVVSLKKDPNIDPNIL